MIKLIKEFKELKTVVDLKKANLTLSDYEAVKLILKDLNLYHSTNTYVENAVNWIKRFPSVEIVKFGIGWNITLKEE